MEPASGTGNDQSCMRQHVEACWAGCNHAHESVTGACRSTHRCMQVIHAASVRTAGARGLLSAGLLPRPGSGSLGHEALRHTHPRVMQAQH